MHATMFFKGLCQCCTRLFHVCDCACTCLLRSQVVRAGHGRNEQVQRSGQVAADGSQAAVQVLCHNRGQRVGSAGFDTSGTRRAVERLNGNCGAPAGRVAGVLVAALTGPVLPVWRVYTSCDRTKGTLSVARCCLSVPATADRDGQPDPSRYPDGVVFSRTGPPRAIGQGRSHRRRLAEGPWAGRLFLVCAIRQFRCLPVCRHCCCEDDAVAYAPSAGAGYFGGQLVVAGRP